MSECKMLHKNTGVQTIKKYAFSKTQAKTNWKNDNCGPGELTSVAL